MPRSRIWLLALVIATCTTIINFASGATIAGWLSVILVLTFGAAWIGDLRRSRAENTDGGTLRPPVSRRPARFDGRTRWPDRDRAEPVWRTRC